jgi:hypothetical protein
MTKFRKILFWYIFSIFFGCCLVAGLFYNIEWGLNIFKFYAWVNLIMTLLACAAPDELKAKIRKEGMSVPKWLSISYDVIVTLTLAAFGMFGYATLIFLQCLFQIGMYTSKEEVLKSDL